MSLTRTEETDDRNGHPSLLVSELSIILTPLAISHITINYNGCWIWGLAKNEQGYGIVQYRGKKHRAHKLIFETFVKPVPVGLFLDHTCHDPYKCKGGPYCPHRPCVYPYHLEPVTAKENAQRSSWTIGRRTSSICINGHPWRKETTRYLGENRVCVLCHGSVGRKNPG